MKKTLKVFVILLAVIGFIVVGLVGYAVYLDRTGQIQASGMENAHFANVPAFIKSSYGVYIAKHKGYRPYVDVDGEDLPYYLNICLNEEVSIKGTKHRLLAMCSTPVEGVGDSHATPGVMDFYVLREEKPGLKIVAQSAGFESGSFGHPGSVRIVRLGRDFYGFMVESGGTWQGETISNRTILVAHGDAIVEAATLPADYDNGGGVPEGCDSKTETCRQPTQIAFSLSIDNSMPNAATYPLRVVANGMKEDRKVQGEWSVPFDLKLWRYSVPDSLKKFY